MCGYTPNSGKLIHWAIDSQLSQYLQSVNSVAVPMDGNPYFGKDPQYGSGLLFFLYMFEHYDPGVGQRIYKAASKDGERNMIKLVERGAQYTVDGKTYQDTFQQLYAKFAIANFVDGINSSDQDQFDKRFHYETIDLRGTVNLSSGTIQLPGVRVGVFPTNGTYPAVANDRLVFPWAMDYLVFGNGDGRDLANGDGPRHRRHREGADGHQRAGAEALDQAGSDPRGGEDQHRQRQEGEAGLQCAEAQDRLLEGSLLGGERTQDGHGLAEGDSGKRSCFGLRGMKERAHSLGGEIDIASAPGRGTTVTLTMAYPRAMIPASPTARQA